jgi:ligand-binding sensor domain-containing protein/signal transduction histidine kinase
MPALPPQTPCRQLITLAFWLASLASFASAQQLPLKSYTTADGLVNDRISRIVRDSRGYLWFCTENGLSRFDGHSFTNYTTAQGLPDNQVDDLLETRSGVYWIATGKGLVRYNPTGSPSPGQAAPAQINPLFVTYLPGEHRNSAIKALYEDRAGTLWVGTRRGLYRLEQVGEQVRFYFIELGMPASEPQNHVVRNILEDRQGALWLATDSGLYRRSPDGTVDRFTRNHGFASERILGLLEDRQGRLWVGDRFAGLCLLVANPQANRPIVARTYTSKDGLGCMRIVSLLETAEGRLWIGTDCGLAELHPQASGDGRSISMALGSVEMADPQIWALAEDSRGNLWVGTPGGAARIVREGFTTYTEADGLGTRVVCLIGQSAADEIVVYTKGPQAAFLNRFDGRRFLAHKLTLPSAAGPQDCPNWLQDNEKRWWLATTGQLNGQLLRFPPALSVDELGRLHPQAFYPGAVAQVRGQVFGIYEDRRGGFWISTRGQVRLLRWERQTGAVKTWTEADGLPPAGSDVSSFAEDRAGNLWMGFAEAGLVRYNQTRFERFTTAEGLPAGEIRQLFIDSKGRLWIASSRGGLGRIDDPAAARPRVTIYTKNEGLSHNQVRSIVEDDWGRLYLGTDQGVNRLDPSTGHIKHFTTADGLANNQVFCSFRDRQGALWFGTSTGLSRHVPEPERPQTPPVVLISRLQISGNPYPVSELGDVHVGALELAPDQRNLRLDFASPAFGAGESLRYQYKLESADQDWSAPTDQRTVNYANLAPGHYKFLVRAVNTNGVMSRQPATLSFTILRPVWQRWWFVALAVGLTGLATAALYRYRVARLLELERMRTHIATDLHDDIGAGLSRVAILSEVVKQQVGPTAEQSSPLLTEIADSARALVEAMREIVWAIDPRRDELGNVVSRVRQFASDVLDPQGIAWDFQILPELEQLKLDPEQRRHLFLIFKEAINNIARHAGSRNVHMSLTFARRQLWGEVHDDGRGFAPAMLDSGASQGNGLKNMRWRAAQLGGQVEIITAPGAGVCLKLRIPLKRRVA